MHRKSIMCEKSTRLKGKKIVLCVTGSIAAVETVKLSRELMRHGADVISVMSSSAKDIIHPNAMSFATGNRVVDGITGEIEHVGLAGKHKNKADLVLVCPCTANTISKIAAGIADTPPTTVVAAAFSHIPIMIVPAMHFSMYEHPIIMQNIKSLEKKGIEFLHPDFGESKAKLLDTDSIVYSVIKKLTTKDLSGKKVLVAAGPTIEEIDDVRFITNKSSGKMGMKLAEEMEMRGADVKLVVGRVYEKTFVKNVVRREKYGDMYTEVIENGDYDIYVLAVAASDFAIEKREGKLPSGDKYELRLIPNKKIVADLRKKTDGMVVGFKAEYNLPAEKLAEKAYNCLIKSGIDLIVANDVGKEKRGFAVDTNEVYVINKDKKIVHIPLGTKETVAQGIVDVITRL
ncbi:MAG: bifunctional phosphopantothenoylcysteine decarboxylase/phosphopantothenate--cysteine ligase CoaBC [Candidatus Methanofastidiosia archaeon]